MAFQKVCQINKLTRKETITIRRWFMGQVKVRSLVLRIRRISLVINIICRWSEPRVKIASWKKEIQDLVRLDYKTLRCKEILDLVIKFPIVKVHNKPCNKLNKWKAINNSTKETK